MKRSFLIFFLCTALLLATGVFIAVADVRASEISGSDGQAVISYKNSPINKSGTLTLLGEEYNINYSGIDEAVKVIKQSFNELPLVMPFRAFVTAIKERLEPSFVRIENEVSMRIPQITGR